MNLTLQIIKSSELTSNDEEKINNFLFSEIFLSNTIFMSPAWAHKNQKNYNIDSFFYLFLVDNEIVAMNLISLEYRGYMRFCRDSSGIRLLIKKILKIFTKYIIWKTPMLISKKIIPENRLLLLKKFEVAINSLEIKIKHSPVFFNTFCDSSSIWGTFLIDLRSGNYQEIYNSFTRSLRRSLRKKDGLSIKNLNFFNKDELNKYCDWASISQVNSDKNFLYTPTILLDQKNNFSRSGFIYEIFIVEDAKNNLLGSMAIYGDSNYVTEAEAITCKKENLGINIHDLIRNQIIIYCIDNKISYYDLAGFNPHKQISKKEQNIYFAKSKFRCGEILFNVVES